MGFAFWKELSRRKMSRALFSRYLISLKDRVLSRLDLLPFLLKHIVLEG